MADPKTPATFIPDSAIGPTSTIGEGDTAVDIKFMGGPCDGLEFRRWRRHLEPNSILIRATARGCYWGEYNGIESEVELEFAYELPAFVPPRRLQAV